MKLAAVILAAVVGIPSIAAADPRVSINGTLGLVTPVGELGADITIEPVPAFEIAIGAGMAFSGPQLSIMPRLRAGDEYNAFEVGVGMSTGHWHEEPFLCWSDCTPTDTTALWLNGESVYQRVSQSGAVYRVFFGLEKMVGDQNCTGSGCGGMDLTFPYVGVSFGHML